MTRRFAVLTRMAVVLMGLGTGAMFFAVQPSQAQQRRIEISIDDHMLWLVAGTDTLLTAMIAAGRSDTLWYRGQAYSWRTPTGQRWVRAKRRSPVWTVPDWHYYERASKESLEVVTLLRGRQYPLADGSRLEVRGRQVVRGQGGRFWRVPQGRELVIDGILYIPPAGTAQREIPGALGRFALDLGGGYLIHGTSQYNEGSIGTAASHGCIRMRNEDVERLFGLVRVGTPVLVRGGGSKMSAGVTAAFSFGCKMS